MIKVTIKISLAVIILLLSCSPGKRKNTISISGAWALYPMTVKWAEEYKKIHPEIRIDISAGGAGKGMADMLSGLVDIGMVSREIYHEELERGAIPIAVAKDAVVAVINEKNPALNEILDRGLTPEVAAGIWITGKTKTWREAFGTPSVVPIHVYTRSDACGAAEVWASFMGKKQEDLLGVGVYGDPGLAQAVRQDSLGIGFNNIGYVFDSRTRLPVPGLKIIPLDLNCSGKTEDEEKFYGSMHELIGAIASGKYPSPPSRELWFVQKKRSGGNKAPEEFMIWILTEGQKYVNEAGYVSLSGEVIKSGLERLGSI